MSKVKKCKNVGCNREQCSIDKPYCSSMCCISDLERQLKEAREALNIDIGDLIMVDDEIQFVASIVSDPVLRVYYWVENEELSATEDEIDCHFLNMNRYKEQLKEQG